MKRLVARSDLAARRPRAARPGRCASTPRRCSRRCCSSAPSPRPSRPAAHVKPWSWADTWPVARIEVHALGASAIVLAGSSGQALAFGPGHVELTPDAGERGTAVYSAHRDTHFRFLKDVAIGDEIAVTRRDGETFRYRVDAHLGRAFRPLRHRSAGRGHNLVLSTCWPLDAATPGRCAIWCMRTWSKEPRSCLLASDGLTAR